MAKDPVCGMTVDEKTAILRGLTAEHQGRTYHFCAPGCRAAFLKEPGRYLDGGPAGGPDGGRAGGHQPSGGH